MSSKNLKIVMCICVIEPFALISQNEIQCKYLSEECTSFANSVTRVRSIIFSVSTSVREQKAPQRPKNPEGKLGRNLWRSLKQHLVIKQYANL